MILFDKLCLLLSNMSSFKLRSLFCFHNLLWQIIFHFIAARTMNFWKRIQIFLVFIFILCKVRLLPYLLGCAFFCQKFDTSSFIARQKNGPYNTGDELSSKKSKPNIWWNLTGHFSRKATKIWQNLPDEYFLVLRKTWTLNVPFKRFLNFFKCIHWKKKTPWKVANTIRSTWYFISQNCKLKIAQSCLEKLNRQGNT